MRWPHAVRENPSSVPTSLKMKVGSDDNCC
eukprot:COSAG06_NODE_66014_length_255_cov_0.980769_1_plen_29_part_01